VRFPLLIAFAGSKPSSRFLLQDKTSSLDVRAECKGQPAGLFVFCAKGAVDANPVRPPAKSENGPYRQDDSLSKQYRDPSMDFDPCNPYAAATRNPGFRKPRIKAVLGKYQPNDSAMQNLLPKSK